MPATDQTPDAATSVSPVNEKPGAISVVGDFAFDASDRVDENLHANDQVRTTGFIGKSSEAQWLRAAVLARSQWKCRAGNVLDQDKSRSSFQFEPVCSYSFWADDESAQISNLIEPYILPSPQTAETLLDCYMSKVHDSFPILSPRLFQDQFRRFQAALNSNNAPQCSSKWQAILNLVFAIGANHLCRMGHGGNVDENNHVNYQLRATWLDLNDTIAMTSPSDIPQIQKLGLFAFYWVSTGQINRQVEAVLDLPSYDKKH